MSTVRRDALRSYLLDVTRDLVTRGVIRRRQGQALEDVLRAEGRAVLQEVSDDFTAVALELGLGILGGVSQMLGNVAQRHVDSFVGNASRALAEILSGVGKKK